MLGRVWGALRPSRRASERGMERRWPRVGSGYDFEELGYETNVDLRGVRKYRSYRTLEGLCGVVGGYSRLVRSLGAKAVYRVSDGLGVGGGEFDDRVGMVQDRYMMSNRSVVRGNFMEAHLYGLSVQRWQSVRVGGVYGMRYVTRLAPSRIIEYELGGGDLPEVFVYSGRGGGGVERVPRWLCYYVTSGQGVEGRGAYANLADMGLKYIETRRNLEKRVNLNLRAKARYVMPAGEMDSEFGRVLEGLVLDEGGRMDRDVLMPSDVWDNSLGDRHVFAGGGARRYGREGYEQVPIGDNDVLMGMERRMALSLDAQEMLLGGDGSGSLALAREQVTQLYQHVDGDLRVAALEEQRVLRLLWVFNGWVGEPVVEVDTSGWVGVEAMAEVLSKVHGVDRGVYGEAVDAVLGRVGLPVPVGGGVSS